MSDAIESFIQAHVNSETYSIPRLRECCCGNPTCAHLEHNQNALDSLERDVKLAAELGQVCECYMPAPTRLADTA